MIVAGKATILFLPFLTGIPVRKELSPNFCILAQGKFPTLNCKPVKLIGSMAGLSGMRDSEKSTCG